MVIIGAKGFAKEILEVFTQLGELNDLVFYDDISVDLEEDLYNTFKIYKNIEKLTLHFKTNSPKFVLGVGNPTVRQKLSVKMSSIGGELASAISPKATIGSWGNYIDKGVNIMTGTIITNSIVINEGVLINLNCTIGHDSWIGKYTELSPGVHISGNCRIGEFCTIGTGAVILPKVEIGNNVIIGAGAVVTKSIADNEIFAGIPAKSIKK